MGEPTPLDWESEGDPRASLLAPPPPPLLLAPMPPPCDAAGKPAAEEADCELFPDTVARFRPDDSSWLKVCCCDPDCDGEKVAEMDEIEEFLLTLRRFADDATADPDDVKGGNALREGLCDDGAAVSAP